MRWTRRLSLNRSLRGRLTLSMSVILCAGFAIVTLLHVLEENGSGFEERLSRLMLGDELPEPWQDLAVLVPFGILIVILVGGVCVWSLRPLTRASQEAARVGPQDPAARIGMEHLPSELVPLVLAINGGLDRLASAFEIERRFTANAAHELRTPLAALNLRLQRVRYDHVPIDWALLDGDIAAMNRLIDSLLDLARKEALEPRDPRAMAGLRPLIDLSEMARMAAIRVGPMVEASGRSIALDLPEPLPVPGDAPDLQDMIRNLIENALVHGAGRIVVRGRAMLHDGNAVAVLDVADEGPAVDPALHDLLFERFRKGIQSTAGSGLGLSIVREVVHRHAGTVGFEPAPTCIVRIRLPMQPAGA